MKSLAHSIPNGAWHSTAQRTYNSMNSIELKQSTRTERDAAVIMMFAIY